MTKPNPQDVLDRLIRAAGAAGADAADALLVESVSANVSYRLGKLEEVERAESADLGLRVFAGQVESLLGLGRVDTSIADLDLEDPREPSVDALIDRARAAEGAAMAVSGVTNSEGGGASFSRSTVSLATSQGFYGRYAGTNRGIGVADRPPG